MLNITDEQALARALDSPLDPLLKALLVRRRDQLLADAGGDYILSELAQFVVIDPHDAVAKIEQVAGYPLVTSPAFEWVADHGGLFEAVTILSDDGFAAVLLVPDTSGIDQALLTLLRDLATRADDLLSGPSLGGRATAP